MKETAHRHKAAHFSRTHNGTTYEVCDCGAVKRTPDGERAAKWHTCALCTHPYGLEKPAP